MAGFRRHLRKVLLPTNTLITQATKPARLAEFFRMIRPVSSDRELVRMGGRGDGGYLLPDDLDGIAACFSPGVAVTSTFELDLAKRGIKSFMADASVEKPPVASDMFDFEKKFLGSADRDPFMTLESWVTRKAPGDADLLLQMDIEGAEYDVILTAQQSLLKRFRTIIIEFHKLDGLLHEVGFKLIKLTFEKLLADFEIVHAHPNNARRMVTYKSFQIPPLLEVTFHRRDRLKNVRPTETFPHALDETNLKSLPDFPLPKCWYAYGR